MAEPITSRELISARAEIAARALARGAVKTAPNPYPPLSAAAAAFQASLERHLLLASTLERPKA